MLKQTRRNKDDEFRQNQKIGKGIKLLDILNKERMFVAASGIEVNSQKTW